MPANHDVPNMPAKQSDHVPPTCIFSVHIALCARYSPRHQAVTRSQADNSISLADPWRKHHANAIHPAGRACERDTPDDGARPDRGRAHERRKDPGRRAHLWDGLQPAPLQPAHTHQSG